MGKSEMYKNVYGYYEENFKRYGAEDERSLGWTKNKQDIRFEQLFRFLKPENGTLLDVGCGFGDMYQYIKKTMKNDQIEYFGIDIMPEFIEVAMKRTGESKCFLCEDILSLDACSYDYVVASGIFGYKVYDDEEKNYAHIENVLEKALDISKVGISINFLSDKTDYHTSGNDFHSSPERVLSLAYKYSRNVILDNTVMPFEFCLTIFKDDSFKTETTVFNRYFEKGE